MNHLGFPRALGKQGKATDFDMESAAIEGGRLISEKQAHFAKFVEELRKKGIKGREYREKTMQWNREHDGR